MLFYCNIALDRNKDNVELFPAIKRSTLHQLCLKATWSKSIWSFTEVIQLHYDYFFFFFTKTFYSQPFCCISTFFCTFDTSYIKCMNQFTLLGPFKICIEEWPGATV